MPKISVIMPSLNVASYIRECMDSVIGQTLMDLEILCVDAGSTDGTWEILIEYAEKDSRIRLIRSEKKSYGYQMNLGIKEASGEYIGIVETDDFILPRMYEELYACAESQNADFVKSDFDVFTAFPDGERLFLRYSLKKYSGIRYNTLFTSENYVDNRQTVDVFIWNGIYKRSFLLENHIVFQETPGAAFQDCGVRYQIALCVRRGFFVENSYYRYRRDNVSSSTYNSKCVLYNLTECKSLIRKAQEVGCSPKQMSFLAREIAIIAHRPYIELLTWGKPSEETESALEEFRGILRNFMSEGILSREDVTPEMWVEIRMFVEKPELYDYYAHLKAETAAESVRDFIKLVAKKKDVILFGSGYIGACVYCLLRNNGIQNVREFCDNDQKKWGSRYLGCMVSSPKEMTAQYPDAFYIITAGGYSEEIVKQLSGYGVPKDRMTVYRLTTFPMDCTNMVMRLSNESING